MSLDQRKPVEAKRIGDTLVASFHRASPPLVWRFDLERNHSFTLALQGDEGEWELGLTSPKGEFHPVARFALRDDAEEAFVKVEHMLAKASSPLSKITTKWIFFLLLFGILGFLGLTLYVDSKARHNASPSMASMGSLNGVNLNGVNLGAIGMPTMGAGGMAYPTPTLTMPTPQPAAQAEGPPPGQGTPFSADDFLKAPTH